MEDRSRIRAGPQGQHLLDCGWERQGKEGVRGRGNGGEAEKGSIGTVHEFYSLLINDNHHM